MEFQSIVVESYSFANFVTTSFKTLVNKETTIKLLFGETISRAIVPNM